MRVKSEFLRLIKLRGGHDNVNNDNVNNDNINAMC